MAKKRGNKAPSNGSARGKRSQSVKTSAASVSANGGPGKAQSAERSYSIPDWRLERPEFHVEQVREAGEVRYKVFGPLDAPVPAIRESRYLTREKSIELYRWMLLNRRMEQVLESLYKQSKVVGGVYFGRGQEACSCASALALQDPTLHRNAWRALAALAEQREDTQSAAIAWKRAAGE